MKDFKTQNTGARVVINPAPYKTVLNLKRVLLKEIKQNSIGLKITGNEENLLEKSLDFTGCIDFMKNVLIGADISEDVEIAIFDCLKYCTYNTTQKIDQDLFDNNPESREDYYEIIISCIEENLRPFIKSLASQWSILAPRLGKSQALNVILAQMNN